LKSPPNKSLAVRYPGPLGEPHVKIYSGGFLGLLGDPSGDLKEQDVRALVGKLDLLADYYQARVDGRIDWKCLAMRLAFAHVPGMQVIDAPRRGRGRPRKYDGFDLYRTVLAIVDEKRTSVANACGLLSRRKGRWYGAKPSTLETRFHADKRRLAQFTILEHPTAPDIVAGGIFGSVTSVKDADRPSAKYPAPPPPFTFGLPNGLWGLGALPLGLADLSKTYEKS
jgi:hypothetical protein